ncbi:MAG: c-type cytochrome [Candidatus Promineifilaceae bacterium]
MPSSKMPAWSQVHGGPFTDEEIGQVVAFIRNWEADAPDRQAMAMEGDPINGSAIYGSTCIVCHGENGQGTANAPVLNDPVKLSQLSDEWYADTIAEGRPAQGMPTWGTVLSPVQIRDLVALLRAWERGETVQLPGREEALSEALHMLEHGDLHAAEHALEEAAEGASGEVLSAINEALAALEVGDGATAEAAIRLAEELIGVDGANADEHNDVEADEHDDAETDEHNEGS